MEPTNGNGSGQFKAGPFIAEIVLAGAVGTGLWLFGERLISRGHDIAGACLTFAALFSFFATVPLTLMRILQRPKVIWAIFIGVFVVLGFIFFSGSSDPSKSAQKTNGVPITTNVTVIVTNAMPTIGVKQQIRALLDEINPQICMRIDADDKVIPVMICDYHREKLKRWDDTEDGKHYFTVATNTAVIVGNVGSGIKTYVNDQDNAGTLTGYMILPTDALKSSPQ